jgi:hypothetical protein
VENKMPMWLIALALAGGGYYLYSRGAAAPRKGFLSNNEYVDGKGVHWLITMGGDSGQTYQFKTSGYGGDSGVNGIDKAAVVASVEEFSTAHTPS